MNSFTRPLFAWGVRWLSSFAAFPLGITPVQSQNFGKKLQILVNTISGGGGELGELHCLAGWEMQPARSGRAVRVV